MTGSGRKRHRNYRPRVILLLTAVGLILCLALVSYFKVIGVYQSWKDALSIPFLLFIVVPAVLTCLFIPLYFLARIAEPYCKRWENHRIRKYGIRALRRKERLIKVFGFQVFLFGGLPIFISICLSSFLAFIVRHSLNPEVDIDEDPITIVLFCSYMIITGSLLCFLSMGCYLRLFAQKKGKAKAIKYVCDLKKPPGWLGKIWLRLGGINQSDVIDYLKKLEEQASISKDNSV